MERGGVEKHRGIEAGHDGDVDHPGARVEGGVDRLREGVEGAAGGVAVVAARLPDAEDLRTRGDLPDDTGDDRPVAVAVEPGVRRPRGDQVRDRLHVPQGGVRGDAGVNDRHPDTLPAGDAVHVGFRGDRGRRLDRADAGDVLGRRRGSEQQRGDEQPRGAPHPSPRMSTKNPARWAASGRDAARARDSARSHHTTVVGSTSGTRGTHSGAVSAVAAHARAGTHCAG